MTTGQSPYRALRRGLGVAARRLTGAPRRIVLMPPAPDGSLGDQAMLDAATGVLTREQGWSTAILSIQPETHPTPLRADAVRINPPAVGPLRRAALQWALARADAMAAVGADVIDGVYGARSSLLKLALLEEAAAQGAPAVVLGCSFSKTPDPAVVSRMAAAAAVPVLARDPVSRDRLEAALERPVRLVADIAFLLEPEARAPVARETLDWIAAQKSRGATVLAVNASGHTLERMPDDGVPAYAALLGGWLSDDPARALLLTPHDTRAWPVGDVEALERIAQALPPETADRVRLMRPPFDAWDVKAVAGAVDAVMTGRMHFAIAALGMGAPPLCVVYQGKFEGLMAHFGLSGLTLSPDEVVDVAKTRRVLDAAIAAAPENRARIAVALPKVRALARSNFDAFYDATTMPRDDA